MHRDMHSRDAKSPLGRAPEESRQEVKKGIG